MGFKFQSFSVHILMAAFLGAFAELLQWLLVPSYLFVRLFVWRSAWNNSAPTGRIFIKFYIWVFFENLPVRYTGYARKWKESRNKLGEGQRVPGGLSSQISMTFGTWSWWGCQPHAFTLRKCSWYSYSLGAESTPGPWYGRKEYVTEKSSDTTGNRSRDHPTSSEAS